MHSMSEGPARSQRMCLCLCMYVHACANVHTCDKMIIIHAHAHADAHVQHVHAHVHPCHVHVHVTVDMAERGSPKKRPSPYRRELAIDDEDRPVTPSQDSPGLSGPTADISLQAAASPAAPGSTTAGFSHELLPKSRLGFNDPFAQTATVHYPPAACTRHDLLPLQQSESEDSSDAEDVDREGSALADEQHLVLERADDTLQRLLREGVWSEPELPAAQAASQAASQLLGTSWRLPGQASAGTPVVPEPAQWVVPPLAPRHCVPAAAPLRAGRKRPPEAESEADADAEVPRLPPSPQPRAWPLVAWRAPRAAAAAAGVLRAELRVFVGTWNMHGKPPPPSLSPWLPAQPALSHDLLVIGTQDSMVKRVAWVVPQLTSLASGVLALQAPGCAAHSRRAA